MSEQTIRPPMPTLFRLLTVVAIVVGLAYGAMYALVVMVEPREREVTVRVPARVLLSEAQ